MSDNSSRELFRSSDDYITKQLDLVRDEERAATRLILDVADLLTGPTSGGNARYLAEGVCKDPRQAAERMKEAAERYLKATKKNARKVRASK